MEKNLRRFNLNELNESERSITNAIRLIEALPANIKLTDAVIKLTEAFNLVADYFDEYYEELNSRNENPTNIQFDDTYKNYEKEVLRQRELQKKEVARLRNSGKWIKVSRIVLLTKEAFIEKIKTDEEFAKKWTLKNKEINDLIKEGEELAKKHEEIRNELPQEIKDKMGEFTFEDDTIVTDIMRKIKTSFDDNSLDVMITPIMYNPENFMPVLGVLVKTNTGAYHKKYTISISE